MHTVSINVNLKNINTCILFFFKIVLNLFGKYKQTDNHGSLLGVNTNNQER